MSLYTPEDPARYQRELADAVGRRNPTFIVETGVAYGASTIEFLRVLDANNHGWLYSVDPNPMYMEPHPRWTLCFGTGFTRLVEIFLKTGPWDFFLHDGDHGAVSQMFEYELALRFVKPGGFVASDDSTWGSPPHRAWQTFIEKYRLTEATIGHARAIQVPRHNFAVSDAWSCAAAAFKTALEFRKKYTGNDNIGAAL